MTARSNISCWSIKRWAVRCIFGVVTFKPTRAKVPSIISVKMDNKRPLELVKEWNKSFQYTFRFMNNLPNTLGYQYLEECYGWSPILLGHHASE